TYSVSSLCYGLISFLHNWQFSLSSRAIPSKDGDGTSDAGTNWLMFELLWRDFFRFVTKKYSSAQKTSEVAPATGCTPAPAFA
uniref:Photolyase/cryptochrome alpha/beta domain-containing protein n=1 Tax=Aegilops tauschii subsp. strangulata TaxID=200361 RepID=A0A453S6M0_AEGTS